MNYPCDLCEFNCEAMDDLREHKKTKHTIEYKCDNCTYKCTSLNKLTDHKKEKHEKKLLCDFCDFETNNHSVLQKHEKDTHMRTVFKCNICDIKLKSKDGLQTHIGMFHAENPYKCDKCNFKCNNTIKLKEHESNAHKRECINHGKKVSERTASKERRTNEHCYFWNTTGCHYGDECRFLHEDNSECRYGESCTNKNCSFFHVVSSRPRKRTFQARFNSQRSWKRQSSRNQQQ